MSYKALIEALEATPTGVPFEYAAYRSYGFSEAKSEAAKIASLADDQIAALEREVEALRSLLSDVTCVAITMLYDTHKQDVLDEFTMDDLKEVVRRSEHLQIEKVEHVYRRGFEALAGEEAGK